MQDLIAQLARAFDTPQPWLTNLAAAATFVVAVLRLLFYLADRSANPARRDGGSGYRASVLWRLVPVPFNVLRLFRIAKGTADRPLIVDYLDAFRQDMQDRNAGSFVALSAGQLPESTDLYHDPHGRRNPPVRHIRHVLRLLAGPSRGGDGASAQLASISRRSRFVRNAVRTLQRVAEPLVLLGDPGSGKSHILRQVALELAAFESERPDPKLVVFVPLREYIAVKNGHAGSVEDLVAGCIGGEKHAELRSELPRLAREGRLIAIFDGMDEMPRKIYRDRVKRLSAYAKDNLGYVKTLFSCRINDFAPEFVHRQMVLLPFSVSQVAEYIGRNLPRPMVVEGRRYRRARKVAEALLDQAGLAELASNPLMLSLITGYLGHKGVWPTTRAQLFESYIDIIYRQKVGQGNPMPEELYGRVAQLAYMITRAHAGTVGDATELAKRLGGARGEETIRMAERCGFVLREPDQPSRLAFCHHQLQEFFTAVHLAKSGEREIPWPSLLGHPRWQETLICLASIAPGSNGIRALGDALTVDAGMDTNVEGEEDGGFEFEFALDDHTEDGLAERVLLASQVLRETRSTRGAVREYLARNFRAALRYLAARGRPTSQVKMLWCWKHAPDEDSIDALAGPLRSRSSISAW